MQSDALKHIRKKSVLDSRQEYQKKAEGAMDSFKIKQMVENNIHVQQKCAKELQSMYDKLIKPKVANGTYLKPAGYTEYREDFAIIRESIKQSLHEVNPNVLKLSCLEFENRCRKQDEKIWTKASINGLQIEAEIQKHAEMLAVKNDKLLQKKDLKKSSEEEKWKAFKEELASEREKERKELEEKYAKLLADYETDKKDLESAMKEKEELNKRLENQSSSYKIVKAKPAMKQTVFKTMLSLIPIVGPVLAGVYERFSSDD
ncbi:uncharacterized protein LOC132720896 [Ruditapes philippinarum]|uniref:uncharacterized protein LOC132720896 n=1 Tax=Ruditapes philippinarum TaxID=129788 RepID=UPI00295AAD14|nr:uncharacterized protein LOC132720896 [Ruditapes philippinarum]